MARGDLVSGIITRGQEYRPASGVTVMLTATGYSFNDARLAITDGVNTPDVLHPVESDNKSRADLLHLKIPITNARWVRAGVSGTNATQPTFYGGYILQD